MFSNLQFLLTMKRKQHKITSRGTDFESSLSSLQTIIIYHKIQDKLKETQSLLHRRKRPKVLYASGPDSEVLKLKQKMGRQFIKTRQLHLQIYDFIFSQKLAVPVEFGVSRYPPLNLYTSIGLAQLAINYCTHAHKDSIKVRKRNRN